jgi:NhaA family Na+:H+ antiporter
MRLVRLVSQEACARDEFPGSHHTLHHALHYPVAFFVLPLFALANTSLTIAPGWHATLLEPNSIGIMLGLVLGKPIGITLFAAAGKWMRILVLPRGLAWKHSASVSILAGIGFTMSIFITLLAFQESTFVQQSKIAILVSSLVTGVVGYLMVRLSLRRPIPTE